MQKRFEDVVDNYSSNPGFHFNNFDSSSKNPVTTLLKPFLPSGTRRSGFYSRVPPPELHKIQIEQAEDRGNESRDELGRREEEMKDISDQKL